jgi:hypothetical protein
MTIVQISSELEMLGFLKTNGTACRFVSMVTKTPVTDIKVKNPWGAGDKTKNGLYKLSRKSGIINANYNTSVRRRIAEKLGVELKEVEYENGPCWFTHLTTSDGKMLPIIQHKDESKRASSGFQLQFFPHKQSHPTYVNEAGEPVAETEVKKWLYAEPPYRPDYKPCVIGIKLKNILELRASGVIIETPALEEAEAILGD